MKATIATRAEVLEAWAEQPVQRYLAAPPRWGPPYDPDEDLTGGRRRMRVWAMLSRRPPATIQAMAAAEDVSTSVIAHDLDALEAAGYIRRGPHGTHGTVQVIIPCLTIRRSA